MPKAVFVLRVNNLYVAAFMVCKRSYRPSIVLASTLCDALLFNEQDAFYLAGFLSSKYQVVVVEQL